VSWSGRRSQLCRRDADKFPGRVEANIRHQLGPSHVYGTGTAGIPARDQCTVSRVLGLQPIAAEYLDDRADAYHARDVPGGGRRRLHLWAGAGIVWSDVRFERAAEDVPVYGGDHVLKGFA